LDARRVAWGIKDAGLTFDETPLKIKPSFSILALISAPL